MRDFIASLLGHERVPDQWMDQCDLRAAREHALHKLINCLNYREQINFMHLSTVSEQVGKKPLDPDVVPFAP